MLLRLDLSVDSRQGAWCAGRPSFIAVRCDDGGRLRCRIALARRPGGGVVSPVRLRSHQDNYGSRERRPPGARSSARGGPRRRGHTRAGAAGAMICRTITRRRTRPRAPQHDVDGSGHLSRLAAFVSWLTRAARALSATVLISRPLGRGRARAPQASTGAWRLGRRSEIEDGLAALREVRLAIDELDAIAGRLARETANRGGRWDDIGPALRLRPDVARSAYQRSRG